MAIGVAAIVRVPFVIHALGSRAYGLNVLIGSTAPILLVTTAGLRMAARTLVSEKQGAGPGDAATIARASVKHLGRWVCLAQILLTGSLTLILPFYAWLHAQGVVSMGVLTLSLLGSVLLCALSVPGAVAWGVLEAQGRTALVNVFVMVVTAGGLAGTVVASYVTHSFLVFVLLNLVTSTAQFYLGPIFVLDRSGRVAGRWRDPTLMKSVRRLATWGTAQSAPALATRAVDPFIIGGFLTLTAVGAYSVAQRVSLATTMIPIALAPVVAGQFARTRASGRTVERAQVFRVGAVAGVVAGTVGVVLCLLGPRLVQILSGNAYHLGTEPFLAFSVLGTVFSFQLGLSSCATGPGALRFGLYADTGCMFVNLLASIWLVQHLGITGPIVGSIIGLGIDALLWSLMILLNPSVLVQIHGSPATDGVLRAWAGARR